MKPNVLSLVFCIVLCLSASLGCRVQTDSRSGEPYVPYVTDQVIINDLKILNDGAAVTYRLEPGNYELEMTASEDGAGTEWVGSNCAKTGQMKQLGTTCNLPTQGQLIISNPTNFGLGKQVSVTIKVTKLGS